MLGEEFFCVLQDNLKKDQQKLEKKTKRRKITSTGWPTALSLSKIEGFAISSTAGVSATGLSTGQSNPRRLLC